MARILYLRDVLELVDDRFNDRAASQQLVAQAHQFIFHVAPRLGKELDIERFEQLFSQLLRDVAPVSKDLPSERLRRRVFRL